MTRGSRKSIALLLGGLAIAGCADAPADLNVADGGFTDGTFSGSSTADDQGATGEATITIKGNDVIAVEFRIRDADGTVRGADHGTTNGVIVDQATYRKAQLGVAAGADYAAKLVETDDLDAVDAITGASLTYRHFTGAVEDALARGRA
jgi:major membrane immunogen (membrane-anchored lipoprotein)